MCLSLPAKVTSLILGGQARLIAGQAEVLVNQRPRVVSLLALKDKLKIGDWVLVQADLVVEKISAKEAKSINLLLNK